MSAESVHRAVIEAFNAGDWVALAATCAPEVVYEETGSNRTASGVDAFVELAKGWRAGFSDLRGTVRSAVATESATVLEISWAGTHDGALDLPTGKLPATGRPIQVEAAQVATVEGGKITRIRNHADLLSLLVQVGAIPDGAD